MYDSTLPPPTPRLYPRWWTAGDLPLARTLWGDPRVVHYLDGDSSPERVEARLALHLGFAAQAGVQYWPWFSRAGVPAREPHEGASTEACAAEAERFAGACGLRPPKQPGEYELGFHLRPLFWRSGYGYEAARAVVAHAFDSLGAQVLWAGRHPHNAASERLLLKLGFVYDSDELLDRTGLLHPWYRLERLHQ